MAGRRDHLFPATSIGRSPSPVGVPRTGSYESLSAHPLLSSTPSYTGVSADQANGTNATPPKYVPYTPRQRGVPSPATTGTTLQPSVVSVSPQHASGGDAKSKLQLMSLKAAAQSAGLDTGSIGWAILERLVEGEHGPEWAQIWEAITTEKATLLLPMEAVHSNENITVDFVKDHVVICDGSSREDAPIITLSGLRGQLTGDTLTFRSSVLTTSKTYQDLLSLSSRSTALSSLSPLPLLPASPSVPYPTFSVPTYTSSLPLPHRPLSHVKPPLPPRPSARGSPMQTSSRLPNPFSFFGKGSATPTPAPASAPPPAEPEAVVDVPAFIIDRHVVLKDVGKVLTKALRAEVKDMLSAASVPTAVADRVQGFVAIYQPLLKVTKRSGQSNQGSSLMHPAYEINPRNEDAEDVAQAFQEFYDVMEEDLYASGSPTLRSRRRQEGSTDDEKERERRARNQEHNEARIKDILEVIERTVCTLLYDRVFSPATADDSSHDQALSSRVALLHSTDLSLAHLGIEVGKAGVEVDSVVTACGEMLETLPACRSPADKSAILVAAHKVIVDGLGRLPPLRLKSDAEIAKQQTPQSSQTPTSSGFLPPKDSTTEKKDVAPETASTNETTQPALSASPTLVMSPQEGSLGLGLTSAGGTPSIEIEKSPEPTPLTLSPEPASLQVRSDSPLLTISPPPEREPTPVSGDILLPLIIFAVVKSNPEHLVSQLLYIQRFRNRSFGGEESYCLINLMAVAEFLENVDLAGLGLTGPEGQVPSTADLTPITLARGGLDPSSPQLPQPPAGLRGRVEQQVDALAGSANKVLSGVVDTSFGVLRSFLPGGPEAVPTPAANAEQGAAPWNAMRPAFGLLRRESGFSIASLAASLPGAGGRERSRSVHQEETGRQMTEVSSRPGSRASLYVPPEDSDEEDGSGVDESDEESDDEAHDTRSIRSFGSMMSNPKKAVPRKSLADRLSSVPGLNRLGQDSSKPSSRPSSMLIDEPEKSPPPSRRTSLLPPPSSPTASKHISLLPPPPPSTDQTPSGSRDISPVRLRLAPPNTRFLECSEDDLKLSEIRELLKDYRRIVEGVRAVGGFEDH